MKRGRPTTGREPFRCTAELRTGRCPSRVKLSHSPYVGLMSGFVESGHGSAINENAP